METVPRVGEGIILSHLKREDFRSQEDYNRFKNNGYEHREWVIEEISWFPYLANFNFCYMYVSDYLIKWK